MEQRCNEVIDCDDASDESDCSMLEFDSKQYRNNYPPVSTDNVKVRVTQDLYWNGFMTEAQEVVVVKVEIYKVNTKIVH